MFNLSTPTDIRGYGLLIEYAERHNAEPTRVVLSICMENDLKEYNPIEGLDKVISGSESVSQASDVNAVVEPPAEEQNLYFVLKKLREIKQFLKERLAIVNLLRKAVHGNKLTKNFALDIGLISPVVITSTKAPGKDIATASVDEIISIVVKYRLDVIVLLVSVKVFVDGFKQYVTSANS